MSTKTNTITIPSCKGYIPKVFKRTFHNFKDTGFHLYEGSAVIELDTAYLIAMSNYGYIWYVTKDGYIKQKIYTTREDIVSAFEKVLILPDYAPTRQQIEHAKNRKALEEQKAIEEQKAQAMLYAEQAYKSVNYGYVHKPSTKGALYAKTRTNNRNNPVVIREITTLAENTFECHETAVTSKGTIIYRNGRK